MLGGKMMENLKSLFDRIYSGVNFDQNLVNKIRVFKLTWISKTDDYIDFISSPLIGVYRVRFSSRDESEFFNNVLGVNGEMVQREMDSSNLVPKNFKVARNAFNATLIYMVHRFYSMPCDKDYLNKTIVEVYNILSLKMLGSIFSNFFPYDVDLGIAQTVYQNLSDKYMIKKEGSWERVLNKMAELLYPTDIHGNRLRSFDTGDYIRVINDVNTRLRSIVKNYAGAIYTVVNDPGEKDKKILSSSMLQEGEEGETIRDLMVGANIKVDYVRMIIPSPNDFINDVKIKLVCGIMGNVKPDKLKTVLTYISLNNAFPKQGEVDFISVSVKQSISYLQAKGLDGDVNKRVVETLKVLKRYYSASKVKIVDVIKTKEYLDNVVRTALMDAKGWLPAPIVIAVMLYIFLSSLK